MDRQQHWEAVYRSKAFDQVSWFSPHIDSSLAMIDAAVAEGTLALPTAQVIDVGGGASTLVDDLLQRGCESVTVMDISDAALDIARQRFGPAATRVQWLCADVLLASQLSLLPPLHFDLWHDRAVFHFLTTTEDRQRYRRSLLYGLKPGGTLLLSTFGPEGPQKCSGLDVVRYSAESLLYELGEDFELLTSQQQMHRTPSGGTQQFLCCRLHRRF
uniref:Methyltransferase type 12 n=1 Tax=mine drainage metagenome TaxID=410659 RepID=E6QM48_9ZZZZ